MLLARWFLLLCVLLRTSQADDFQLISLGENWRYFKGISEPSTNAGFLWIDRAYDDTSWTNGRTGFSSSGGYGEVTLFSDYGTSYKTIYFRKRFTIAEPANIRELILRIDYDDGFVAYLNGVEVARRGVSGYTNSLVPVTETAPYHPRGAAELVPLINPGAVMVSGTNVLAIQLLGTATDASMTFVPELLANVVRGPYLQNTTPSSTQIIWNTHSPAASSIEYGTNITAVLRDDLAPSATNHVATLTGLIPNTQYFYRIANRIGETETFSDWYSFRTFKLSGPVTFHVIGDSGWGSSQQLAIATQMKTSPADFLMHVGDMVYPGIAHYNADLRLFSVYREEMRTRPWFLALGNHEQYVDRQAALQLFYLPTNSVTGTEHYYSFDHGDAHFVVAWADLAVGAAYHPGSAQYDWMDADLARSSKPWKFMFFHHTWRTSSAHRTDNYDGNLVPDSEQLDQGLAALARKRGVQIIFNGHDHVYERLAPSGGPISFVSGGGGAVLYNLTVPHPDSAQFYAAHHFLRVNVQSDQTLVEAVALDGSVFDKVHLKRNFPARTVYQATWHAPIIEPASALDLDGNVHGQRFDFIGMPLNGPMGLYTSAGRLFVNNDHHHLYLGFDEVMLRAGEDLFLFIELPALTGQTNLLAIGNSRLDPNDEGADGLDFLTNLAFENFSPSIGIILGDEFADAASRNFTRAGHSLATGQGAFYLVNGLPAVPEQRLTQFNRSPQLSTVAYEQNADYIKISIPFTALGSPQPGDIIRVGAITALGLIDGSVQTRKIDTGGVAYSVRREEGRTFLEGVEVRLAESPLPDTDADGLSDADEEGRGTDPNDPDSDGDGMPDGWEVLHSLNPLGADDLNDADADGFTNGMEYRAGTNPTNSASHLSLHIAEPDSRRVRLTWTAMPGKTYKVQCRDTFSEPFRDVQDPTLPRTAQSSLESFWIHFSPDLPARSRYYRVLLAE